MKTPISDIVILLLDKNGFTSSKSEVVNAESEVANNILVTEKEKKIMRAMEENPKSTYMQLSQKTGFAKATPERMVRSLKEKGVIIRIGADKGGYWKIVK